MSALRLDGKHAVVTGGASGIGQAIVERLAEFGARVTVLDLNARDGFPFRIIPTDVSSPESVAEAFDAIDEIAPIDILVCSAGIGFVGNILGTTPEKFDQLMGVNARGVFLCNQQVIQRLTDTGRPGAIVNICSIAAKVSLAERFAYSATKGAVLMMTKSIAQDYTLQRTTLVRKQKSLPSLVLHSRWAAWERHRKSHRWCITSARMKHLT